MNDADFSLPDLGILMGPQGPDPNIGSDVTAPDDVLKSSLHSNAPFVDFEDVATPLGEQQTNIPDLEALTSPVLPTGNGEKQSLPSQNWAQDSWAGALGGQSSNRVKPCVPVIPLTVDGLVASEGSTLKAEHSGWQYGGECWSSTLYAGFNCENQPVRRWSSTSYPAAFARRCSEFDDYGCPQEQTQFFMQGHAQCGASGGIHGNNHERDLQFAGNQQPSMNMCGKHCTTRTMRHTIDVRQLTDVRVRSMSLTDDRFRYTSLSDGRSRSFEEEDPTRMSDEVRLKRLGSDQGEMLFQFSDDVGVPGQLERRRMSNKTAAMKSRQRKRERAQMLKKEWLDTECDNTRMQYEIVQLRKQVASLEGILRNHECKRRRLSPHLTPQSAGQTVARS